MRQPQRQTSVSTRHGEAFSCYCYHVIANETRKPEPKLPELEIVDQVLFHVYYVCLPNSWARAIELLREADQSLDVSRTYQYAPTAIYGQLIKLQSTWNFSFSAWNPDHIIRGEAESWADTQRYWNIVRASGAAQEHECRISKVLRRN
jgi:hypothetical protein